MDVLGGILLWSGVIGAVVGLISLAWPLRIVGIRSRKRALLVVAGALLTFAAGVYLPIPEIRVGTAHSRLDESVPVYQFYEVHQIPIAASRDQVDAALRSVQPDEIRYYRALTWLRRATRPGVPGVLNPPAGRPILEVFAKAFRLAADEPGREILLLSEMRRGAAGVAIGFDFSIEEVDAGHCLLRTETRSYAVGRHVRRGFAAYWRMIYPGSALIRREWLKAIRRRAEASATGQLAGVFGLAHGS